MTSLAFTKMHALGNDFIVLRAQDCPKPPTRELCAFLSDRHRGIGCDQILIIDEHADQNGSHPFTIHNANGQLVEQCGNGVRALAHYLFTRNTTQHTSVSLHNAFLRVTARRTDNNNIEVLMNEPQFGLGSIQADPLALETPDSLTIDGQDHPFHAVSMGNPHLILIAPAPDQPEAIGQQINQHPAFPEGINVSWIQITNRQSLQCLVFERGVGLTQACGSAACSAHAVAKLLDFVDATSVVSMPGGDLTIQWQGPGHGLTMSGPAHHVFEGQITL